MNNNEENYKSILSQVSRISPLSIVKAGAKIFSKRGFDDEDCTLQDIARDCKVEEADIIYHFGSKAGLFSQVIHYLKSICNVEVFEPIFTSRYTGIRRIVKYLHLVSHLLNSYPECGYIFKAYFSSQAILSEAYSDLMSYYKIWQQVTESLLKALISEQEARKVATIYVTALQGSLINAMDFEMMINSHAAEVFLWHAVKKALLMKL